MWSSGSASLRSIGRKEMLQCRRGSFWASCAGGGFRRMLLRTQMCLRYRSGHPRRKNWNCIDSLPLHPARTGSFTLRTCVASSGKPTTRRASWMLFGTSDVHGSRRRWQSMAEPCWRGRSHDDFGASQCRTADGHVRPGNTGNEDRQGTSAKSWNSWQKMLAITITSSGARSARNA